MPTCHSYDPAYAYEIAIIVQDGIRRMYEDQEDRFYYLTIYNENYAQPPMPQHVRDGILNGIYRYRPAEEGSAQVHLFGSGPILNEALRAQNILAEKYNVQADVWSVTSYNELRRNALDVERWNRLHPAEPARRPYLVEALAGSEGPIIASTDYMKVVADQIAPWLAGRMVSLGTDGFGRSENREYLRKHFENGAEAIAAAALSRLARDGRIVELGLDPESPDPVTT
jgi:pyruvate dehydrogenase E1 component